MLQLRHNCKEKHIYTGCIELNIGATGQSGHRVWTKSDIAADLNKFDFIFWKMHWKTWQLPSYFEYHKTLQKRFIAMLTVTLNCIHALGSTVCRYILLRFCNIRFIQQRHCHQWIFPLFLTCWFSKRLMHDSRAIMKLKSWWHGKISWMHNSKSYATFLLYTLHCLAWWNFKWK